MACLNSVNNTFNEVAVLPTNNGYIFNTLQRIDQIQKEASCINQCEGCEGGLLSQIFNTKPVSIYLTGGTTFSVTNPEDETTPITLFRIESVKDDAVILRLLLRTTTDGVTTTTCLNYTVVLRINCICGLQCFAPICCERCPGCTPTT